MPNSYDLPSSSQPSFRDPHSSSSSLPSSSYETFHTAFSALSSYSRVDIVNTNLSTINIVQGDQTTYESTKIDHRTNYNNTSTSTTIDSGNVVTNVTRNEVHLLQTVNVHINIHPTQALNDGGMPRQSFPVNVVSLHTLDPRYTSSYRSSNKVHPTSHHFDSVPEDDEQEEGDASFIDVDASRKDGNKHPQTRARSDMGKFKTLLQKVTTAFKVLTSKRSRLRRPRVHTPPLVTKRRIGPESRHLGASIVRA